MKKLIALYLIGAIFTNSYVRLYRSEQWLKEEMKIAETSEERTRARLDRDFCVIFSSMLWPAYVAAKTADAILTVRVKVEPTEILKSNK